MRRHAWRDPRSWGLVGCASVCTTRAIAYIFPSGREVLPIGLKDATAILPLWVYGLMWGIAAVGAVVIALRQWPPKWWHAFLVAPPMLWGGFYFTSALAGFSPSGGTTAFFYWALAEIFACMLLVLPRWR